MLSTGVGHYSTRKNFFVWVPFWEAAYFVDGGCHEVFDAHDVESWFWSAALARCFVPCFSGIPGGAFSNRTISVVSYLSLIDVFNDERHEFPRSQNNGSNDIGSPG
jgi:hypothetical protein